MKSCKTAITIDIEFVPVSDPHREQFTAVKVKIGRDD